MKWTLIWSLRLQVVSKEEVCHKRISFCQIVIKVENFWRKCRNKKFHYNRESGSRCSPLYASSAWCCKDGLQASPHITDFLCLPSDSCRQRFRGYGMYRILHGKLPPGKDSLSSHSGQCNRCFTVEETFPELTSQHSFSPFQCETVYRMEGRRWNGCWKRKEERNLRE